MKNYTVHSNCWISNINLCELSRRNYFNPVNCNFFLGFRLIKRLKI
jgi:hypothetical protein